MDKVNFYKKVIDKYFDNTNEFRKKWNNFPFMDKVCNVGAFSMIGVIMLEDKAISVNDIQQIHDYFIQCQQNAESK